MKLDFTLGAIEHQRFYIKYHKLVKKIAKTSKLSEALIQNMLITYYKFVLANGKGATLMTRRQFSLYAAVHLDMSEQYWIESSITNLDPTGKTTISPEAFVALMEMSIFGSLQEKIEFCFNVYDQSGIGYISRPSLCKHCSRMVLAQSTDDHEHLVGEYVDFIFRRMDIDRDGRISFDDYSQTVQANPDLLEFLGPVLPDLTPIFRMYGYSILLQRNISK